MDLLKDLEMLLLNFRFDMVYTIHKMLVLLKNNLNYLKNTIFKCSFIECNRHLFIYIHIFS